MAENLAKKPSKGILKTSTSFEKPEIQKPSRFKETKWDEMNILATLHPADKDYGHMKIEEPKTPYNWADGEHQSGDEADGIDASMLAEKIQLGASQPPKVLAESEEESEEEEESEHPESKAKRKSFESKRKLHYNEFQAVKLARKLMEEDEEGEGEAHLEDDEDEEEEGSNGGERSGDPHDLEEALDSHCQAAALEKTPTEADGD